jgi:Fur family ferric uptake transcriptional regulator
VTASVQERLRAVGLRVTAPREAVLTVLESGQGKGEHLPVATIAQRARDVLGSLSTQAVYDCLEVLTAAGLARRIEPAGHPARYEGRVGDNHHHLVCRGCGKTEDVDCVVGSAPCLTVATPAGFVVDEAEVTFWGHCSDCQSAPVPSTSSSSTTTAHHTASSERNPS